MFAPRALLVAAVAATAASASIAHEAESARSGFMASQVGKHGSLAEDGLSMPNGPLGMNRTSMSIHALPVSQQHTNNTVLADWREEYGMPGNNTPVLVQQAGAAAVGPALAALLAVAAGFVGCP
mmetsp:Transcript_4016/g.12636  ORF Transcript_4016/g.12636 Transcript_4016/m.12636 type:complete len:124 (+) Transcript_4016:91-462(+)